MNESDSNTCFICAGGEWVRASRAEQLQKLLVGDLLHSRGPTLPSQTCLVTAVTETIIYARSVTIQLPFEFDRETGIGVAYDDDRRLECTIISIAPLPVEIHHVILGIDRKYRLVGDPDGLKLNESEIKAFIFIDTFYKENPLPVG